MIHIQEEAEFLFEHEDNEKYIHQRSILFELEIAKLGISLINSNSAEEISYIYFKDISVILEKDKEEKRFKLDIFQMQIDDQLSQDKDWVILRKSGGKNYLLLTLNFWLMNNEGFDDLIHFREFNIELHPLELCLNGNFWIEFFKYVHSIFTSFIILNDREIAIDMKDKNEQNWINTIDTKSKLEKMIYFEILNIDQMNIKFSFKNNSDLLNQTNMSQTLLFIVGTLMNMK